MGSVVDQPARAHLSSHAGGREASHPTGVELRAHAAGYFARPRARIMNPVREWLARRSAYAALSEEIRLHLDEATERLMASGMPRRDAELAARRAFGNVTQLEESARDVWQWPTLESVVADVTFALRQLRRTP